MKLVFIDQLGCYAAILAAAYVTGKIDGQPSWREIMGLPAFAGNQDLQPGNLRYIGTDPAGNQVYTLGVGNEAQIMTVSAGDLCRILDIKEKVCLVDVSSFNGLMVRASWYLGLIPCCRAMNKMLSAYLMQGCWPRLLAYLKARLAEAGLEYS